MKKTNQRRIDDMRPEYDFANMKGGVRGKYARRVSLRLPASLHHKIPELSDRDEVSINQFIATAVAEKAAALLTLEYLEARGRRGSRTQFDRTLARARNVPPMPGDELPNQPRQSIKAL